jgi:hypothetical protein
MKLLSHCVGAVSLLAFAVGALGQTDQPYQPSSSEQYAEVVLRVEGMT